MIRVACYYVGTVTPALLQQVLPFLWGIHFLMAMSMEVKYVRPYSGKVFL